MNFVKCPACTKPCHPKATQCRWCGVELSKEDKPADPGITPAILKEAQELRDWKPESIKVPPPFSIMTCVLGVVAAAAFAVDLTHPFDVAIQVGARICFFVLTAFFLWSAIHRDWSVLNSRKRATPAAAVEYHFNRLARHLYGQAGQSLAGHPSAANRHAKLKSLIRQLGLPEIERAVSRNVQPLGGDFAVVEVDLTLKSQSHGWFVLFSVTSTQRSILPLQKLAVYREGRWYLVNGLLTDRLDRTLIRVLSGEVPDKGRPSASPT